MMTLRYLLLAQATTCDSTLLATTWDLPNQVEPIHTSHNSHTYIGFPISSSHNPESPCVYPLFQATTKEMPQRASYSWYHFKQCRLQTTPKWTTLSTTLLPGAAQALPSEIQL